MAHKSKLYVDAVKTYDQEQIFEPAQAFALVKTMGKRKFDETVEVAFRLGVDPRKADQMIRGTVSLPHGTGKTIRVIAFATGDVARDAAAAGADLVGAEDLIEKIAGGFLDFDVAIASPELMAKVGVLGRTLGPRGLMPNPKTGTVTNEVAKAVAEFKAGRVEYKTDRYGNVHVPLGKVSFEAQALLANYQAVLDEVLRAKPASAKGRYMRTITISSTMGPGIKLDTNRTRDLEEVPVA